MSGRPNIEASGTADSSEKQKKSLGLSPIQLIAGGGAAAVASVIGGQLGVAGTVVGAFIISIISGIALPLFRASLEKSHEQIKRVVPKRSADAPSPTPTRAVSEPNGVVRATSDRVSATPLHTESWLTDDDAEPTKARMGRKAWVAIGGTAAVFVIGVGAIFGIQSLTGLSLSHGTSALQSGLSQVVTNGKSTRNSPTTDPKDKAPATKPSAEPTAPTTEPAAQPTPTPTPTDQPAPNPAPTAPDGSGNNPAPTPAPNPAPGNGTNGGGNAGGDGGSGAGQVQPTPGAPGGAAAK